MDPHDPRSVEIFRALEWIDLEQFGDYFCWKSGGDGDNGEVLLDELDIYFKEKDEALMNELNDSKVH